MAGVVGLGLLAALYVLLLLPQLDRPLVYDDVNFAFAARAVAETGLAFANAGHMSDRWDFSRREQWALWHPPLYIYLLGLQFKLFGVSETSARLLGCAFGLGTGGLTYLTARALVPGRPRAATATGLLAAAFFMLSPLALQSALILDIDGTVLTFLLTLMALVLVRFPPERDARRLPILAGLFALALWAKLTTPLGFLAVLAATRLLAGRVRQAAIELVVIGLGGGALFLLSWALACVALGMPFDMPFAVTWVQLWLATESTGSWLRSPAALAGALTPALLWAGPYLSLLFAAAGLARLRSYLLTRKIQVVDLLVGFGTLVYLVYLIKLAGGFPKYHVAMLPFWSTAAAALLVETVRRLRIAEAVVLVGAGAGCWWYFRSVPEEWIYGVSAEVGHQLLALPLLLAAGFAALLYLATGAGLGRAVPLLLAAMAIAWGPGVVTRMALADYSTTYFHGTRGHREAAALLGALVGPDEFYVASKDVAWYAANQRYLDQDTFDHLTRAEGAGFGGSLLGYDVRVLALWQRPDSLKQHYRQVLAPGYELVGERDDYAVWVRRQPRERARINRTESVRPVGSPPGLASESRRRRCPVRSRR